MSERHCSAAPRAMRERRFWVLPNGEAHLDAVRDEMNELFTTGD
jgi:hypothetical protein